MLKGWCECTISWAGDTRVVFLGTTLGAFAHKTGELGKKRLLHAEELRACSSSYGSTGSNGTSQVKSRLPRDDSHLIASSTTTTTTKHQWISTLGRSTLTLTMRTYCWRQNYMTLTLVDHSRLSKTQKQKPPQSELHSPSEQPPSSPPARSLSCPSDQR